MGITPVIDTFADFMVWLVFFLGIFFGLGVVTKQVILGAFSAWLVFVFIAMNVDVLLLSEITIIIMLLILGFVAFRTINIIMGVKS